MPAYLIMIPIIFWITIAALERAHMTTKAALVQDGWLFDVHLPTKREAGPGMEWAYWTLFDFSLVELRALKNATTNIVLLVVIGVLNLPIYVPALGCALKTPFNMDHEFVGQGVANLLAGAAGTVPNILVSRAGQLIKYY